MLFQWKKALLTFLLLIILGSVVSLNRDPLISDTLLTDIKRQWKNTETNCFLMFNIEQTTDVNWESVLKLQEPYTFIISKGGDDERKFKQSLVHLSSPKFKSECWTQVITVGELSHTSDPRFSPLRNSVFDQYVFISREKETLEIALDRHSVLNTLARKYGMIVGRHSEVGYLVEPNVYTGNFEYSKTLDFYKEPTNNLNGRIFSVAYVNIPPYIVTDTSTGKQSGMQYTLLEEISKRANFTLRTYSKFETPGLGIMKYGTWTGGIGEMVAGRALAIASLAISFERFSSVTFPVPDWLEMLTFCKSNPKAPRHWTALIKPLSSHVWIATFVSIVIFILVTRRINYIELSKKKSSFEYTGRLALLFCGMILEQSFNVQRDGKTRLLLCTYLFFACIIGVAYRCNLVSFLTLSEKRHTPENFRELYESNYSIILYTIGGMELEVFRTATSPVMKGIAERMRIESDFKNCVDASFDGNTACISWAFVMETQIAGFISVDPKYESLTFAKESGTFIHGGIGLRRGSIYLETINRYVLGAEGGHWIDKWKKEFNQQVKRNSLVEALEKGIVIQQSEILNEHRALSVQNLVFVFGLAAFGIGLSFVGFILEILNHACKSVIKV